MLDSIDEIPRIVVRYNLFIPVICMVVFPVGIMILLLAGRSAR